MRNLMGKFPLWLVLTAPFVLLIAAAVGLTGYLAFHNGQNAVNELADQLSQEATARIYQRLDAYLATPPLINQLNLDAIRLEQLNVQDMDSLGRHFVTQLQRFDSIMAITYAGEQAEGVVATRNIMGADLALTFSGQNTNYIGEVYKVDSQGRRLELLWASPPGYDPRARPWYQAAVQAGAPVWTPIFMWTNGEVGLDAVVPLHDKNGQLTGVLDTSLTLAGISEFLQSWRAGKNGQTFIMDRSGLLVASSTITEPFSRTGAGELKLLPALESSDPVVQTATQYLIRRFGELTAIKTGQPYYFDLAGERQLAQVTPYQDKYGLDWLIVVVIPESDYMAQIEANNRTMALLIAASLLVSIGMAVLLARWITQPLARLNQAAKALAQGDWTQQVTLNRRDELGQLAHSFNSMAGQLHQAFAALEDRIIALNQAQEALRQREQEFKTLVENAPDMIARFDQACRHIYVNPVVGKELGRLPQEILGKTHQELGQPPDLAEWSESLIRQVFETGQEVVFEMKLPRPEGVKYYLSRGVPELAEDGTVASALFIHRNITERKQAEEALRESEARYRRLVEGAPDVVYTFSSKRGGVYYSPRVEQVLGYSAEYLYAHPFLWNESIHPEDRTHISEIIREFGPGKSFDLEYRIQDAQGSWRWLQDRSIGHHIGDDEVLIEGVATDITKRKQAEDALRESEARYRLIAENTADVIWTLSFKTGKFTYVSPSVQKLRGYTPEEVLNQTMAEALTPESLALVTRQLQQGIARREQGNTQQVVAQTLVDQPCKDGTVVSTEVVTTVVYNEQGQPVEAIGVSRDITERKRAEEIRLRLSTAIEQAAESIVITDTQGTIQYVNPAFERVTGYNQAEALSQNPRILKSGKQDTAFYENLWATLIAGQVWQGRLVNKRKDGSLYTEEATISPVRNENGAIIHYVAVKRDVTHELQLEEQYYQAQKMEAIGRLTAGIAHDFNNLLTAINGFTELIQFQLLLDDPLQEPLGRIADAGRRAADLVRQLLVFSRKQVVEPQVLSLNAIVETMDKLLRRIIGEPIELKISLTADLWPVKVDPAQLEQVIVNLAVNARDAMPNGGHLTLETANIELDNDYAAHHLEVQPGQYVLLAVSDDGLGMSAEVKTHLFEPFFTTKGVGKGTGLGLATIFSIVKQHGGHIWVYSEEGQSTTFKVYLPRAEGDPSPVFSNNRDKALPRGKETVLLAEDEAMIRELAGLVLRQQDYTVLVAANGAEALRLAQEHSGPIHLLLTDVVMPGQSGASLAEQLVQLRPEVKVIFMSGYTDEAIVQQGVLASGVNFLQKPFSPMTLLRKVREVLNATVNRG